MRIFSLLFKLFKIALVILALLVIVFQHQVTEDYNKYKEGAVPYLMYHSIGIVPGWEKSLLISEDLFEGQLKWLKENGYIVISAAEARRKLLAGENVSRNVVFTFDDGYENNYTNAYRLLKKYGYRGSFYVVGSMVGKPDYMSYDQLSEMIKGGMEVGSHTMSHDPLNIIDEGYLPWEIFQPMNLYSDKLKMYIQGIAYPNGAYTPRVIAEIEKYPQYKYALTGKPGCNTRSIMENTPFELRRMGVYDNGQGVKSIEHRLQKAYIMGYLESKGISFSGIYSRFTGECSY